MMVAASDKSSDAYARLKHALLQHAVPADTFINIRALAIHMRVSPTPVREALIRLADEELIRFASGRGYYSKPVKAEELRAEYEAAYMMLKYALEDNKIAYDRISSPAMPLRISELDRIQSDPGEASCAARYLETLYERVSMVSGNPKLVRMTRHFSEHTHHIRCFALLNEARFTDYFKWMVALENQLIAGDRSGALDILVCQYRAKADILLHVLQEFEFKSETSTAVLEDLLQ